MDNFPQRQSAFESPYEKLRPQFCQLEPSTHTLSNCADFTDVLDDAYFSAKTVAHSRIGVILIILVHYPSKLHMDERDQSAFATDQARRIQRLERRCNTENTIVIGDFNLNPHEDAMISAAGLNAVCCSDVAREKIRRVKDSPYTLFYNPMWRFYTKPIGTGHGTYFSNPYGYQSIYWNIFDQVILRPSMIDEIHDIDIVQALLTPRGETINLLDYADHLPITLTIRP